MRIKIATVIAALTLGAVPALAAGACPCGPDCPCPGCPCNH
ncbi:MAG: hypothetical protein WKG00_11445 [Polyangiaceae bacterium]